MSITRAKPAGWGLGDKLISPEMNQVDANTTYALDKRAGQTDTLASVVTLGATGRIIQSVSPAPNADTTYQIDTQVLHVRIGTPNVLTAQRSYTLSNTNASNGDEISFFFDPAALGSFDVLIKDNGGTTLATLGPSGQAHWGEFKFISGSWKVKRLGGTPKLTSALYTASGTWTCPVGITEVEIHGVGGGGGGGGSGGGGAATGCSGSGGGGALLGVTRVAVTPGVTYTITIGAGGSGGAGGASGANPGGDGGDGGDTSFDALATFYGAGGGSGGGYYGYGSTDIYPVGGRSVRAVNREPRSTYAAVRIPDAGQGGSGSDAAAGTVADRYRYGGGAAALGGAPGTSGGSGDGGGGGGASGWVGCAPGAGGDELAAGSAGTLGAGGGGGGANFNAEGPGGAGGSGALRIVYVR